jgi:hypothetical protein
MKEKLVDFRQQFLLLVHYENKVMGYSVLWIIQADGGEGCAWIFEKHGQFKTYSLLKY